MKQSHHKTITVALAGNPNSGKTSLFNELVGANQKVGNFSGVTVEKIEGSVDVGDYTINFVDLPGTYSLTAYSPEEVLARNFIIENRPDVVINVVDATNLDRNLYLTTQLMELECNLLIALNIFDEVEKKGIQIETLQLEKLLGTHIIKTSSRRKLGLESLIEHIIEVFEGTIFLPKNKVQYPELVDQAIQEITEVLKTDKELCEKYPPGWLAVKLIENDRLIYQAVKERPVWIKVMKQLMEINPYLEKIYGSDAESLITENRYSFIRGAIRETVSRSNVQTKDITQMIDSILINRLVGLPVFILIMWAMFQLIFKAGNIPVAWIETFFIWTGQQLSIYIANPVIKSVIVDGVIAGVGGVLVYLPVILMLFLALTFLEATGYMARAAFVIDKIMHTFGLHGKSAIPLLTGFGCSIPAFMSTRILKNRSDRITTLLIIPFISCSAKLPVFTLIIAAFFSSGIAGNVMFLVYFLGIIIALASARLFKATLFKGESEPFVMELPPYRLPSLKVLWYQIWQKGNLYLKKAATVILLAAVVIWFSSNFPRDAAKDIEYKSRVENIKNDKNLAEEQRNTLMEQVQSQQAREQINYSIIGRTGRFIEPVISPLGFDWRIGISLLSGVAAKEIIVSTLATTYALTSGPDNNEASTLTTTFKNDPNYNARMAISLIVFVLLYVPCIPASIVFHREAGSWKWTVLYFGYTLILAWLLSFSAYHIAGLFI